MVRRDRRGRKIGYNWWREMIVDLWFNANAAWERDLESSALGYETEELEYKLDHPRPTLKGFMVNLAGNTGG